jgi:tripartite-type tricarboxylate transporter receptor subunit TctC
VRLIVPFAAGGPTDIAARMLSGPLQQALGQSVVIENRGGGGGNIGIGAVANAAPDGYTVLFTSSAFLVNPGLFKRIPYDPFKSFAPVAELVTSANIITANPKAGIKSIAELIARAKAEPGKLNYAHAGNGTTPHLSGEFLKLRAGIDIVPVPFPGAGPAVQAVVAGTTEIASIALPPAQPHILAGSLNALAVTGATRWPDLPDTPTMIEAGFPGFVHETIQAMLVPAGTPPAIVERLAHETLAILQQPDYIERSRKAGFSMLTGGPDALKARIVSEVPAWRELIAKAGIQVQ